MYFLAPSADMAFPSFAASETYGLLRVLSPLPPQAHPESGPSGKSTTLHTATLYQLGKVVGSQQRSDHRLRLPLGRYLQEECATFNGFFSEELPGSLSVHSPISRARSTRHALPLFSKHSSFL